MEYSLKNKIVIVTGGANGIGYGIVDKYLEQEAKVAVILDIDEVQGYEAVKILTSKYGENKADFIKCDVTTDLEPVAKSIMDTYKTVDVLILNAGIAQPNDPKRMIDVYLTSVIEWSMKFAEYIGKDNSGNGGTFLLNSSIFGIRNFPFSPIYSGAKYGVVGFARSFGHMHNFLNTGIRVIAMCPGFTETNLSLPLYDPKYKDVFPDQELLKFAGAQAWQKVEAVGKAAVEIFKIAKSGSVWEIEGGRLSELT